MPTFNLGTANVQIAAKQAPNFAQQVKAIAGGLNIAKAQAAALNSASSKGVLGIAKQAAAAKALATQLQKAVAAQKALSAAQTAGKATKEVNNTLRARVGKAISTAYGGVKRFGDGFDTVKSMGGTASPDAINTFTLSVDILCAKVGAVFIPTLVRASFFIQKAADVFVDLNKATDGWLGTGVAVVGGLTALAAISVKVVGVIGPVVSGVMQVTSALGVMGTAAGIGAAAIVAAAAYIINKSHQHEAQMKGQIAKRDLGVALDSGELNEFGQSRFQRFEWDDDKKKHGSFRSVSRMDALDKAKTQEEREKLMSFFVRADEEDLGHKQKDFHANTGMDWSNKLIMNLRDGLETDSWKKANDASNMLMYSQRMQAQVKAGKSMDEIRGFAGVPMPAEKGKGGKDTDFVASRKGVPVNFSSFAEAGRRAQLGALNKDPAQARLEKLQQENNALTAEEVRKMQENSDAWSRFLNAMHM